MRHFRCIRLLVTGLTALLAVMPSTGALAASPEITTFPISGGPDLVAACGSYNVIGHFTGRISATTFVDQAGNPVRLKLAVDFNGTLTNSLTGNTAPDNRAYTVFVDVQTGTTTFVGVSGFHVVVPGQGTVTIDAGRVVFGANGTMLFEAGQHPQLDTPQAAFEPILCAALA